MPDTNATTADRAGNPYVGPEQFQRKDHEYFRGRERETSELSHLIAARRLVLLYAESGAGKSSLINAGLIPALEERGFEILPVARVTGTLPTDCNPDNIFAYYAMARIDQSDEPTQRLANLRLTDFLLCLEPIGGRFTYVGDEAGNCETPDEPEAAAGELAEIPRRLLVLDQFEELFTTHAGTQAQGARADFLSQIAEAMADDPYLYVLLSMRADYRHFLTRYVHLLPDGLDTQYYMSRMRTEAALRAVKEPAALAGRPFAEGVAEELVERLSLERSQEDEAAWVAGESVEPVQLQVVCFGLWQSLQGSQGETITRDDLTRVAQSRSLGAEVSATGDPLADFVDSALGNYYEKALAAALAAAGAAGIAITEGQLRDWFSKKLITESGTRGFLSRGISETEGVPESVVTSLVEEHIIRSETQKGGRWIELVHDTFIEPVRHANRKWLEQRISETPWMAAAEAWETAGRPEAMLLTDDDLAVALNEAGDLSRQSGHVRDFLNRSKDRKAALTEQMLSSTRRQRLALMGAVAVAMAALAVALFLAGQYYGKNADLENQRVLTESQKRIADWRRRNAEAAEAEANEARDAAVGLNEELAGARASIEALSLADDAAEYLSLDNLEAAMLLSVAANERESGRATPTLLSALDEAYQRPDASFDGSFRMVVTAPVTLTKSISPTGSITGTRLLPGTEPGTVIAASAAQVRVWNPTSPEAGAEAQAIPGALLAVSRDGLMATADGEGAIYIGDNLETILDQAPIVPVDEWSVDPADMTATFSPDGSAVIFTTCYQEDEQGDSIREPDGPVVDVAGDTGEGTVWTFMGNEGDSIEITLDRIDDGLDPVVELQNAASGEPLASNDDSGGDLNSLLSYVLPFTGEYQIVARGFGSSSGRYRLHLDGPEGYGLLAGGTQVAGRLSPRVCQFWRTEPEPDSLEPLGTEPDVAGGIADLTQLNSQTLLWVDKGGSVWQASLAQGSLGEPRQLAGTADQHAIGAVVVPGEEDHLLTFGCLGQSVACASSYLQLWSPADPEAAEAELTPLGPPLTHGAPLIGVATLELDGTQLVALDADGSAIIWQLDMSDERLREYACEAAGRDLSYGEFASSLWPLLQISDESLDDPFAAIGSSLVCDDSDHGLHISFAERAAEQAEANETCSAHTALPLAEQASPDALRRFRIDHMDRTFTRLLSAMESEAVDAETLDSCLTQIVMLAGDDAPPRDELETVLNNMTDWGVGTEAAVDRISDTLRIVSGWSSQLAADSVLWRVTQRLHELCPLGSAALASDECSARFEIAGAPRDLPAGDVTVTGSTTDPQPLWAFEGEAGAFVAIQLSDTAGSDIDPYVALLSGAGETIASDDDGGSGLNSSLVYWLPAADHYYVLPTAVGGRNGEYALSFAVLEPQATLDYGQAQIRELAEYGTIYWEFDGEAFDVFSVAVTGLDGGASPLVRLLDESGAELPRRGGLAGETPSQFDYQLPSSGTFYLLATSPGQGGRFEVMVDRQSPAEIAYGESIASVSDHLEYWAFDGQEGDSVAIAVDSSASSQAIDPYLTLYDANGMTIASDGDSGEDLDPLLLITLPSPGGRYYVEVGELGQEGEYSLSLVKAERLQPLAGEQTLSGQLQAGDYLLWEIDGRPYDSLSVELTGFDDGVLPVIRLLDAERSELIRDEVSEDDPAVRIDYQWPRAGRYYLVAGTAGDSGQYEMTASMTSPEEIAYGQSETGVADNTAYWSFEGRAGDLVSIEGEGDTEARDPYLVLYNEAGEEIGYNGDSEESLNPHLRAALAASGRYYIELAGLGEQGDYTLSLSRPAPQTLSLPAQELAEPLSLWTLAGQPGQLVRLAIAHDDPSDFSSLDVMRLYQPDGATSTVPQSEIILTLASAESYTITLDSDSFSPLLLETTDISGAIQGDLAHGDAILTELLEGSSAYWTFEGGFGPAVTVNLADLPGPILAKVFGPDGQDLVQREFGAEDTAELIIPASSPGVYVLAVRPLEDTPAGLIALTLEQLDTFPIPQTCEGVAEYGPIDVGSQVIIGEHTEVPGDSPWPLERDSYVGRVATVTSLTGNDEQGCPDVHIDLDGGTYYWRIRDMTLVSP